MRVISFILFSCILFNNSPPKNTCTLPPKNKDIHGIWQLNYYPDSILIKKSINNCSKWSSDYAINIWIRGDSCGFFGWNDRDWWLKMTKINNHEYVIGDSTSQQYFEFLVAKNKILEMRQISNRKKAHKIQFGSYYPYHRVKALLSENELKKKITREWFAGKYKLIYNDTFTCDRNIVLDTEYAISGIHGISSYNFESIIDIDFPLDNIFELNTIKDPKDSVKYWNKPLSFQFKGDTLILNNYKVQYRDGGDVGGYLVTRPRIKMVKISR